MTGLTLSKLKTQLIYLLAMSYLLPSLLGLPNEPTSSTHIPSTDGSQLLAPAEAMYSTVLQLRILQIRKVDKNHSQTTGSTSRGTSLSCNLRLKYCIHHPQ